jgi:hypothetical protein
MVQTCFCLVQNPSNHSKARQLTTLPCISIYFIAHRLTSGLNIGSVNKDIRTLKHIFNLAIEPRGYLAEGHNPFGKLRQRKKAKKPIRYVKVTKVSETDVHSKKHLVENAIVSRIWQRFKKKRNLEFDSVRY